MQNEKGRDSKSQNEVVFTQEEVNNIMRKRLKRAKHNFNRDFEMKLLQIEVIGRLGKENIPTRFAEFIMVSKNHKRTRKALEKFVAVWHQK